MSILKNPRAEVFNAITAIHLFSVNVTLQQFKCFASTYNLRDVNHVQLSQFHIDEKLFYENHECLKSLSQIFANIESLDLSRNQLGVNPIFQQNNYPESLKSFLNTFKHLKMLSLKNNFLTDSLVANILPDEIPHLSLDICVNFLTLRENHRLKLILSNMQSIHISGNLTGELHTEIGQNTINLYCIDESSKNNIQKFRNSYVFIIQKNKLLYITSEAECEEVSLTNVKMLSDVINDPLRTENPIKLSKPQFIELIVLNGGHIPTYFLRSAIQIGYRLRFASKERDPKIDEIHIALK